MFCAYCGKKIEEHSSSCPFCGNSVSGKDIETGKEEAPKADDTVMNTMETAENTINDGADNSSEEPDKEGKGEKAFNKLIEKFGDFLECFLEWHEKSFKKNKVLTIALIIAEAALVLWLYVDLFSIMKNIDICRKRNF